MQFHNCILITWALEVIDSSRRKSAILDDSQTSDSQMRANEIAVNPSTTETVNRTVTTQEINNKRKYNLVEYKALSEKRRKCPPTSTPLNIPQQNWLINPLATRIKHVPTSHMIPPLQSQEQDDKESEVNSIVNNDEIEMLYVTLSEAQRDEKKLGEVPSGVPKDAMKLLVCDISCFQYSWALCYKGQSWSNYAETYYKSAVKRYSQSYPNIVGYLTNILKMKMERTVTYNRDRIQIKRKLLQFATDLMGKTCTESKARRIKKYFVTKTTEGYSEESIRTAIRKKFDK